MKISKKFLSLLLTFALAMTSFSFSGLSAGAAESDTQPTVSAANVSGKPGTTVEVPIIVKNNPGVAGAAITVSFGSPLVLTKTAPGTVFKESEITLPGNFNSPYTILWDSGQCNYNNGTVAILTFEIPSEAAVDSTFDINVSCKMGGSDSSPVDFAAENGSVLVISFTPGDLNDDGEVDIFDLIPLRKYIVGGYGVTINERAADVNADGEIDIFDVLKIRKHIVDGTELIPSRPRPKHTMEHVPFQDATCTEDGHAEYWHCTTCNGYFSDEAGTQEIELSQTVLPALGHTWEHHDRVEPTETEMGKEEYDICTRCGAYKSGEPPKDIPVLAPEEYGVSYDVANGDVYLESQDIVNDNPKTYISSQGAELLPLSVPGYTFDGWYDAPGASGVLVRSIAPGETGNKRLYARWTKQVYTVMFDSPDVPFESVTYTVDTGVTLNNAEWYGYTFVGWSTDDGFIVNSIKPGTVGNITLHANWTSNRNRTTSYSSYEKPLIIEDNLSGKFLFIYDIGVIDNVPLSKIENIGNTQKLDIEKEYEVSTKIEREQAATVANAVANATTRSSGWTLSKEWNDIYESGSECADKQVRTQQRTDSSGHQVGGNYFVSNSKGGASHMSTESGGSQSVSAKVTTEDSKGINSGYDVSTETYEDTKLVTKNEDEWGVDLSIPLEVVDVGGSYKHTNTVEDETASGRRDKEAFHANGSSSVSVGTENCSSESSHYNVKADKSSNWNSSTGYEKSYQTSRDTAITNALSSEILKTTKYNLSKSLGGEDSQTVSVAGTEERKDEYSSTLMYAQGASETTSKHISFHSDRPGYYRLVMAGTVHVYGVVGYDVATSSYYTYTFNVLDDERHEYLDYSKDNANFNDCENGLVTFEIPYEVNEYIAGVTGKTEGLIFDLNGNVIGFDEPDDFDGSVIVPQYYAVDNGDGTYSAYKTTGLNSGVFKDNQNIKQVVLPIYVTEIPDQAFSGCTNLENVVAYGVERIGADAFRDCTSLNAFSIDNLVAFIGDNAFKNVEQLDVMASKPEVADGALGAGAKRLTLNLSMMDGSFDDREVVISSDVEYFGLISDGASYKNLRIQSDAEETFISNMTFTANKGTPLRLDSPKVTLNRVIVDDCPGFALILLQENTDLALYGTVRLNSTNSNTVLCKNVTLRKANPDVIGELNVSGNLLVCGEVVNKELLIHGGIVYISAEQFENYVKPMHVAFNANGGVVGETQRDLCYGEVYGTLPTPTRENYTFVGWFTAAEGGTQVTADTVMTETQNVTLYAHWELSQFMITFDPNGGTVSPTSKTAVINTPYGELPTPTRDYYTFVGWFTAATGGTQITASSQSSSAVDITLYAHWELSQFMITFNANGGKVSPTSKTAVIDTPYGELPTPTRDYYTFVGWFTAATGGTQITASSQSSSAVDITLYAHWKQNPVSDWVKAGNLPAGAQVTNQKWTYTETKTIESKNTSEPGYTQIGSRWVESGRGSKNYSTEFHAGFDKNHRIYKDFAKGPLKASETTTTKRTVSDRWGGYVYWHWMYSTGAYCHENYRPISPYSGTQHVDGDTYFNYTYFYAITSSVDCPYLDNYYCCYYNMPCYDCWGVINAGSADADHVGTPRCFRFNYRISDYVDYYKMFKYQRKENKESATEVKNGGSISNVQKWVKYRAK